MSIKSRIKKLEERANVGFAVVVPEVEYLGEGEECTGAVARLEDGFAFELERGECETITAFQGRFLREYRNACKQYLTEKVPDAIVLDHHVREL